MEKIKEIIRKYYELEILEISEKEIVLKIPKELAERTCHPYLADKVLYYRKGEDIPDDLYKLYSLQDCQRLAQLLSKL